jgi:staphylococcal nuclease domain-containing protein 1
LDLQKQAKLAKKGRWSEDEAIKHIRDIKWTIDDPMALVNKYSGQKIDAVVEQVILFLIKMSQFILQIGHRR